MENKACGTCKHFRVHYVKCGRGRYAAILDGHCVKPRIKRRSTGDKACEHWTGKEKPPEETHG